MAGGGRLAVAGECEDVTGGCGVDITGGSVVWTSQVDVVWMSLAEED